MPYFVVTCSEDGIQIREMTSNNLKAELREYVDDFERSPTFFSEVPEIDKGCWYPEDGMLIIKGDVVVPEEVKVVKEYKV